MAFTIYRSTDPSAPVLTGENGKLVDLLDAVLVNGYGSKVAAGWGKAFSGTSKAAYRAPSGNRFYLRVQDDGPGTAAAKESRLTGYEAMSDIDTGTGVFPTIAQGADGAIAMLIARKSNTADTTARPWIIVADHRTFYVMVLTGDTASYRSFMFGEFYSILNTTDNYRTMLVARNSTNTTSGGAECLDLLSTSVSTPTNGHFTARGYTGAGGSIACGVHGDSVKNGGGGSLIGSVPMPNSPDGGLFLSPVWVHDSTTSPANHLRGRMRGFWHFCHVAAAVGDQESLVATGELAGKTFLFVKTTGNAGVFTFETSDTLETN